MAFLPLWTRGQQGAGLLRADTKRLCHIRHHQVALDDGAVKFRQHVRLAVQLELDQRIDRIGEHGIGGLGIQRRQIGRRAEIAQQQEAQLKILRDDPKPVPGDLGTIAMKAMEKAASSRFARSMASEIRSSSSVRFGRPVSQSWLARRASSSSFWIRPVTSVWMPT